jgi:pyruvate dehydrogenase E1 component beta subunit
VSDLAITDLLIEEHFARDKSLLLMATSPPAGLAARYGRSRVRTFPISEPAMVGMAIGAAMTGLRPVVDLNRASFLPLVMDQIVNHAAMIPFLSNGQYQVPMLIICVTRDSLQLGPQHEQCPYGALMTVPGIGIVVPGSLADLCGLIRTALSTPVPTVLFVDRLIEEQPGLSAALRTAPIPFGQAATLRDGADATVIAVGAAVERAVTACARAAEDGIDCTLLDPRTLAPLDLATLASSARATGRVVLVDDGPGVGAPAQLLARLSQCAGVLDAVRGRVETVAAPNVPVPPTPAFEQRTRPSVARIRAAIEAVMTR